MKCPECVRTGQRSTFESHGGTISTAMAGDRSFYDEDGVRHVHLMNKPSTKWTCSNRHSFWHSNWKCPAPGCDYGENEWTLCPPEPDVAPGLYASDSGVNYLVNKRITP